MVGFRNNVGDAPLAGWVAPSSQQIAFARGTTLPPPLLRSTEAEQLAHVYVLGRLARLRGYQQHGYRMDRNIRDGLARGIVLQCNRRPVQRGHMQWDRVRDDLADCVSS